MKPTRIAAAVAALVTLAAPAAAQFSTDLPGVPRASIPLRGNTQTRTVFELSGYRLTDPTPGADSTAKALSVGARLGFGRSYRIGSRFEAGFDFTFAEGFYHRSPEDTTTVSSGLEEGGRAYFGRATALYGLRVGGKFRPLSLVSPDGYGLDVAIGAAFQPSLKPVYALQSTQDTTLHGGLLGGAIASDSGTVATDSAAGPAGGAERDLFGAIDAATQLALMVSYRSPRFTLDAALVSEQVLSEADSSGIDPVTAVPPLASYSGFSARVGALVRLRPGFSAGASWWGSGAPPWRDQVLIGTPDLADQQFGIILSWGSRPESGTDLVIASPTGSFGESVRLYIRGRGTK